MDPALKAEIDKPPAWMYPWPLDDGVTTPILDPELPSVHQTRLELLEQPVRAALAAAGPGATVIDFACNEGWFSHQMLEWGAAKVVGVDIRPELIRRAELVRDHHGITADQLELVCADVYDLDVKKLGSFDVVLCLGLIYHLENPIGAMRIARAMTKRVCVVETQLTRQTKPIVLGNGRTKVFGKTDAGWAARVELGWEDNPVASAGGVVSLTPNRAALLQAAGAAGFGKYEIAKAGRGHNRQYVVEDRAVLIAWP